MERNNKTLYIIRFNEGNETKTLKFWDFDSALYLLNQFELDGKQYVLIKEQEKAYTHRLNGLLDYKI